MRKYISKPLLLNGLKFDLRMYVCIAGGSDVPMSAWVCREGLVTRLFGTTFNLVTLQSEMSH